MTLCRSKTLAMVTRETLGIILRPTRQSVSLRSDHRLKGRPKARGGILAISTTTDSSSGVSAGLRPGWARVRSDASPSSLYRRTRERMYSSCRCSVADSSWTRIPWALREINCPRRICTALRGRFSHRPSSFDSAASGVRARRHTAGPSQKMDICLHDTKIDLAP